MFGRTNRATPSRTTSGGTARSVSSSNRGSGNGYATNSSVTATRRAASGSGPSTQSKTQGGGNKSSSTASSTSSSSTSSTGNGYRSSGSARSTSNRNDKKDKKDGTEEEELAEYQKLYVIVFSNGSYDSYNKRHCALLIEHENAAGLWRRNMIDIEGAECMWRVRESVNRNPRNSVNYHGAFPVKSFMVGHGAQGRSDRQLRDSIYNARIDNEDPEWNCQNWLEGALHRLRAARFLTNEEVESAINAALDMVLEAPREPISLY
ncbi:hypothetical protein MYCTH_2313031 [Thermothelomyces thermophilus ATCC 42464]|uniref:Uncharacterized protein n=1 Tax=Thermothelomyces thermophilus (strain ATCC 42464 / BCRC 31852 / DSM 1799) TaxID=573729 RepID=G2QNL0_THET4|nr:uncharacterized protein MYCTH_2313031 [Thermothelomyces thermophilus ATCC 42464]AEO62083.1 hypothetical protein MYCTH_2313031 [Thermothelomyces thermophilus ATCC 42464]